MIDPNNVYKNNKNISLPELFYLIENKYGLNYICENSGLDILIKGLAGNPLFTVIIVNSDVKVMIPNPMLMDRDEGEAFYKFIKDTIS